MSNAQEPTDELQIQNVRKIVNDSNAPNRFSIQQSVFAEFDSFFEKFDREVSTMQLQQTQIDKFYLLCQGLIEHEHGLFNGDSSTTAAKNYIINKLKTRQSSSRRRTILKTDELYVAPKAIPIGLKWRSQKEAGNDIIDHKLVQTTFQYVAISVRLVLCSKFAISRKCTFSTTIKENIFARIQFIEISAVEVTRRNSKFSIPKTHYKFNLALMISSHAMH